MERAQEYATLICTSCPFRSSPVWLIPAPTKCSLGAGLWNAVKTVSTPESGTRRHETWIERVVRVTVTVDVRLGSSVRTEYSVPSATGREETSDVSVWFVPS